MVTGQAGKILTGRQISYITLILTGDFTFCLTGRQILEISSEINVIYENNRQAVKVHFVGEVCFCNGYSFSTLSNTREFKQGFLA